MHRICKKRISKKKTIKWEFRRRILAKSRSVCKYFQSEFLCRYKIGIYFSKLIIHMCCTCYKMFIWNMTFRAYNNCGVISWLDVMTNNSLKFNKTTKGLFALRNHVTDSVKRWNLYFWHPCWCSPWLKQGFQGWSTLFLWR